MKCYDIIEQNTYGIKLSRVVQLEDVGDEFITADEMKEMGLDAKVGFQLYERKAKAAINRWIKKIPSGKTSIKCTDEDLIEALRLYFLDYSCGISDILEIQRGKGTIVRSGNVFRLKPKAKTLVKGKRDPRMNDWFKLMNLAQEGLAANGIYISGGKISKDVPDRKQTLLSLKKVVRWYDMVAANKSGWYNQYYDRIRATKEEMYIIKRMWWKPELVVDFTRKK